MPPILFDAGANSPTLLHNMKELDIDTRRIGIIVISHAHGDHTGNLRQVLQKMRKKIEILAHLGIW